MPSSQKNLHSSLKKPKFLPYEYFKIDSFLLFIQCESLFDDSFPEYFALLYRYLIFGLNINNKLRIQTLSRTSLSACLPPINILAIFIESVSNFVSSNSFLALSLIKSLLCELRGQPEPNRVYHSCPFSLGNRRCRVARNISRYKRIASFLGFVDAQLIKIWRNFRSFSLLFSELKKKENRSLVLTKLGTDGEKSRKSPVDA